MSISETAYVEDDTPRRFKELLQQQAANEKNGASLSGGKGKANGKGKGKEKEKGTISSPVDDRWVVRPGESFREFNARIRQSGLSVPPGVSEVSRYPRNSHEEHRPKETIPAKRFAAPESSLSSSSSSSSCSSPVPPPTLTVEQGRGLGERTKQKRKEYLKQRRDAKKLSKRRRDQSDSDEYGHEHELGGRATTILDPDMDANANATNDNGNLGRRGESLIRPSLLHTRDVVQAPPTLKVIPKATLKINHPRHHHQQRRSPAQRNPSLLPLLRPTTSAINK